LPRIITSPVVLAEKTCPKLRVVALAGTEVTARRPVAARGKAMATASRRLSLGVMD
jgi:hypothetical protein